MSQNYICMDDFDLELKYELSKCNPHDTVTLFYDPEINRFLESSFGYVVHDIYRLVRPWQIMLFKKAGHDCVFPDVTNHFLVELIYPDDFERDQFLSEIRSNFERMVCE